MSGIWAVVPVKETVSAKQRLAALLPQQIRQALALAMLEDVLAALSGVNGLAGVTVVTVDEAASRVAARHDARLIADGARDGHTGAVTAAARLLASEGKPGFLTLPGDIPLVSADEIGQILAAHFAASGPAFTIVPARDELGSNAIACSPPGAVPLRFGEDSFFPHLRAAESCGIVPRVISLPGIGLDIDTPEDLAAFSAVPSATRTRQLLEEAGILRDATLLAALPSPAQASL